MRDYLAICWDSSDNIPGITWIWPKKAQVLLNHFWTLEKIYEAIEAGKSEYVNYPDDVQKLFKWKTLEKFIEWKDNAFLSQKLATLDCEVELPWFDMHDYEFSSQAIQTPELHDFFRELEFFSLLSEEEIKKKTWNDTGRKVQIIGDEQGLSDLEKKIFVNKDATIVLDTETTSLDVRQAELVWISILIDEDNIFYINLLHNGPSIEKSLAQWFVSRLLESDLTIVGHNLKYDLQILELFLLSTGEDSVKSIKQNFGQMGLGI